MSSSPVPYEGHPSSLPANFLDFSPLSPIYVLPTHLDDDELHEIEDQIQDLNGDLTYDIKEAKIILGKISTKKRAELELRIRKLSTQEVTAPSGTGTSTKKHGAEGPHTPRKRVKISEIDDDDNVANWKVQGEKRAVETHLSPSSRSLSKNISDLGNGQHASPINRYEIIDLTQDEPTPTDTPSDADTCNLIKVVKLQWLNDCRTRNEVLDISPYLVYEGKIKMRPPDPINSQQQSAGIVRVYQRDAPKSQHILAERPTGSEILERARSDVNYNQATHQDALYGAAPHGERRFRNQSSRSGGKQNEVFRKPAKLMELTTEEYESAGDQEMPPAPDWVKHHQLYACQRVALINPPNGDFIEELKKIRLARILTNDEIGVRAYSTSIASLASYPYKIINPKEILRLPGCDIKIANLWIEWKNSNGKIKAAEEAQNDPTLKILNLFYEIWGVGATTAREFYYEKGWTDLDDIVEYGWDTLTRVQQIGVKYYDEFQKKIPRSEVEFIASKVREHAVKVRDEGIELMVVGGYRRGKKESGDVDIIVSHRHLDKTAGLVQDIVESLEQEGWITHTLTLSLTNTHRNQSTLPFKTSKPAHGVGFDTLDKALVVWQDPVWPNMEADLRQNPNMKNPNVHRRVDIIVSPWRTVGCAVLGWTSGTTFQRDLRRYARIVKGWKFDSSGIRDRTTGEVVELEGPDGVSGSMVDAEKRVFEGFGLEYREPWERCTG
ncbi:uncharacterized protein PV09_06595 [Verruconis gallopava]|uniref:DNA polymerase lambda n=1 Tax=Verruconis gallopava TaxID=253628 RepID=A0A0D2A6C0_9PEZI|nr:uncharacterized protein PV09_06595 [Verruconis gallopava]KIW02105.1 hypothetical protein PV09_06595 [Verruconis gallopava]